MEIVRVSVRRRATRAALTLILGLTACSPGGGSTGDGIPPAAPAAKAALPLIPAGAGIERVNDLVKDPARDPLPADPRMAEAVKLGLEIFRRTPELARAYVGNRMTCANCHMNGGQREKALPLVGVAATFPQYRGRDGRLLTLEDRIAGCFQRSLNGSAPPHDSREMLALSAYIAWISEGQPVGATPTWLGQNRIAPENLLPIERLDPRRGEQIFLARCVACHGVDGQGIDLGFARPGPLWGPDSWNDGAGAARIYTLAGYLRYAMPLTVPGSLTDEEAQHVAAYINSKDRPYFPAKDGDYPGGEAPVDAVYYPRYPRNPLLR